METRGFALERREQTDDGKLRVAGRAVIYNTLSQDLGGFRERFLPGSLDKTLSEQRDVGLLYSHDSASVLASTRAGNLQLRPDVDGLSIEAELSLDDPDVIRLAAKMDAGTVDKMSFGFRAVQDRWTRDDVGPIREVVESQLIETSAVWLPAYQATHIEGRAGLGDLPVGALATMPAEVRDQVVAELRDGKPLTSATRKTINGAISALEQLQARSATGTTEQVRRIAERILQRAETQDVEAREHNLGQWIESMIHLDFTIDADHLAADGLITRDERLVLSAAIGDALEAFVARVEAEAPQLYDRALWDGPAAAEQEPRTGGDNKTSTSVDQLRLRARLFDQLVAS